VTGKTRFAFDDDYASGAGAGALHTNKRLRRGGEAPYGLAREKSGTKQRCEHGRRQQYCRDCGGVSVCIHGHQKRLCNDCGGSSMCIHGRQKHQCKYSKTAVGHRCVFTRPAKASVQRLRRDIGVYSRPHKASVQRLRWDIGVYSRPHKESAQRVRRV
jgi:hypothetical protein